MNSRLRWRSTTALMSGHRIRRSRSIAFALASVGSVRERAEGRAQSCRSRPVSRHRKCRRPVSSCLLAQQPLVKELQPFFCRSPPFKAIGCFVRADLLSRKNFPHRPRRQLRQARMFFAMPHAATTASPSATPPRSPGLSAFDKPARQPRLRRNLRRAPRQILQRRQRTKLKRLVDAAPDLLAPRLRARDRRARRQAAWSLASRTGSDLDRLMVSNVASVVSSSGGRRR